MNTSLNTSLLCYYGGEIIGAVPCGGPGVGVCNTTTGSCACAEGYSGWSDFVSMDETQSAWAGACWTVLCTCRRCKCCTPCPC